MFSLGWQVVKHYLDGGRVRVYLNAAIMEPEFVIATNRSGKHVLDTHFSNGVTHRGGALELAQLVVENPGKYPITIYSPGFSISGHKKKYHTIVPRMFTSPSSYGADSAIDEKVVRLEPYDRVTFLLDYWSVVPRIVEQSPSQHIELRGCVEVSGRSRKVQKSKRKLRWKIQQGDYTAIEGSPKFSPLAVIWRSLYVRLPASVSVEDDELTGNAPSRDMLEYILDNAMSHFDERPKVDDLAGKLKEVSEELGYKYLLARSDVKRAYEDLDRMEDNLNPWTTGLFPVRKRAEPPVGPIDQFQERVQRPQGGNGNNGGFFT
ncbi:hypothetical protein ACT3S7_15165 [Corynebacterium sp. AOP34-AQ2-28]|uniref:hypothetical protein n=1 Tax=Corynebacterium sp. AOP34-AQ2-28 TaxID=3457689 RepID=UPI0040348934